MNTLKTLLLGCISLSIFACNSTPIVEINASNNLDIARKAAVIEINLQDISAFLSTHLPEELVVIDGNTNQVLLSQLLDLDEDGSFDQLIKLFIIYQLLTSLDLSLVSDLPKSILVDSFSKLSLKLTS